MSHRAFLLAAALLLGGATAWATGPGGTAGGVAAGGAAANGAAANGAAVGGAAANGAAATVFLRAGNHPGFGRLVLDLPPSAKARFDVMPQDVVVRVAGPDIGGGPMRFGAVPAPPRNAGAITVQDGALHVGTARGVVVRPSRPAGRLVLDLLDPPPPSATAGPARAPGPPRRSRAATQATATASGGGPASSGDWEKPGEEPRGRSAATPMPISPASAPSSAAPAAAAAAPEVKTPEVKAPETGTHQALAEPAAPTAVAAEVTPVEAHALTPPETAGSPTVEAAPAPDQATPPPAAAPAATPQAAMLPVEPQAGLAALRRGEFGLLVADAHEPADKAAWRAVPGLAEAMIDDLPGATLVSFKLAAGKVPMLRHQPAGWSLEVDAQPPQPGAAAASIGLKADAQNLMLAVDGASHVVSIADPLGGGTLLVGTLAANAPPAMVEVARLLPALAVLATLRGVAVEPLSDSLDVRAVQAGFLVDLGPQRAALGSFAEQAPVMDAARFRRLFDLPQLAVPALLNRQSAAAQAVSAAPSRTRGLAQLRLAETMVALGFGAEAQAVLRLAVAADGRLVADAQAMALGGVAALLAGRPAEAAGLDDPAVRDAVAGSDEIAFWRAFAQALLADASGRSAAPEAVRTLAALQDIALSYPAPLRDRLLPLMAETLASGDAAARAGRLIQLAADAPGLDYARALLDIAEGRTAPALLRLDRLSQAADRRDRSRAAVRAVELRLATGELTPAQAADKMDPLIAAWRGGDRELAIRMRVAALRLQAGQFRASLAMLRETRDAAAASNWSPPRRAELVERMAAAFAATLAHDDASPIEPLEFVSLIEDNADLLPGGAPGEIVARRVAERLASLDLPARAEAALRRLVDAAPKGPGRGALGSALAALQLQGGDAQAALMTLSASTADDLPGKLVAERTLVFARATAQRGDIDAANGALAALGSPEAESLRTDLLEKAGRWSDAAAALSGRLARDIPPEGLLAGDGAALVLRLASAAAQAGEADLLDQLRAGYLPRMPAGPGADLLHMLTEPPVRGVADLPRAAQEAALARSVMR